MFRHIITLLLILTFSVNLFARDEKQAEQHYKDGVSSIEKKEYLEAISHFTRAIGVHPTYAEAYYFRAKSKKMHAEHIGYSSNEYYYDLIMAIRFGYHEAKLLLEEVMHQECFTLEQALNDPSIVFCADFSHKVLSSMPEQAEEMMVLSSLSLFNNKFTEMPSSLEHHAYLLHLNMSSNTIKNLNNLPELEHLTDLSLNKNYISEIPSDIKKYKHLKHFKASKNKITTVHEDLYELEQLESLDLSYNALKDLPAGIEKLKNLKTLSLVGNPIDEAHIKKLKELLPHTQIYY